MLNFQQQKLLQLLKQVEGLSKIEIYDLIYHMESLLLSVSSPLDGRQVEKKLSKEALSNVLSFNDYEYYYRLDSTTLLDIYKRKSLNPLNVFGDRLYFISCFNKIPFPLTRQHIEKTFKQTAQAPHIHNFLKQYKVTSKNPLTHRFRIIELFLSIENEGLEELVNTIVAKENKKI